jgi:hypothetical protein
MSTDYPKREVTHLRVDAGKLEMTVDGRRYQFELSKYSRRLALGTPQEQAAVRLSPASYGLHWPLLDEDLTIDGLIAGRISMEGDVSFERWLSTRSNRPNAA